MGRDQKGLENMPATKPNETVAATTKRSARPQVSILLSQDMKAKIEQLAEEERVLIWPRRRADLRAVLRVPTNSRRHAEDGRIGAGG